MNTQIIRPPAFQRPSGELYLSGSDQLNLADGVKTLVEINTVPLDSIDGIEDKALHRIKPGVAGRYSVVGQVQFTNVVSNKSYLAEIKHNGIVVGRKNVHSSNTDDISATVIIPSIHTNEILYFELMATSNAGVDTVDIKTLNTRLEVQRVR